MCTRLCGFFHDMKIYATLVHSNFVKAIKEPSLFNKFAGCTMSILLACKVNLKNNKSRAHRYYFHV